MFTFSYNQIQCLRLLSHCRVVLLVSLPFGKQEIRSDWAPSGMLAFFFFKRKIPHRTTFLLEKNVKTFFLSFIQMVLIAGGPFWMGTDDPGIPPDGEGPRRLVHVDSFYMDTQEVTNQQFQSFVNATGYITEVFIKIFNDQLYFLNQ